MTMQMATLADRRAWGELTTVFTSTVRADWSALSGVAAAAIPAADLIAGWRAGLTATQHLLANQDVTVRGDHATAAAYVHAAHRLASTFADDVWIVASSYTYDLVRTGDGWRIAAVAFHPAWGRGNQQIMTAAATDARHGA
ncbi:nuclear transport factor 2 family protein [Micromonospora sp. STR1s_5]|nr:nuclear transport factor 2 family protein [Micromonospora sp. STR1s_5]